MNVVAARSIDLSRLRELCGGAVLTARDDGYDAATRPWNLAVSQRPVAVAYPGDADEVAAVVRAARRSGLRVAPQSTGHHAGAVAGSLEDAILLRTSALRGVTIDPRRRVARVGAGALWHDVVAAAAPHGLVARHASAPDLGVVGCTLGGGLGWLARRHGLQCGHLLAADVVTGEGQIVRADAERDPELLWALRGGGGGFGVVTAVEIGLLAIDAVYAGVLAWDAARARRVLARWSAWTASAPDDVTTAARVVRLPWLSRLPGQLRGRWLVAIDGAILGDPDRAAALLRPLRDLRPEIDSFGLRPACTLLRRLGEIDAPTPVTSTHALLDALDPEVIERIVDAAGPASRLPVRAIELRQLGGALSRPAPSPSALERLDGAALLYAVGTHPAAIARVRNAVAPWTSPRTCLNFADGPTDPSSAFDPPTFDRLRGIRARVDPDGRFAAAHAVPTA